MITTVLLASYALSVLQIAHMYRRSQSDWVAADRSRGWWLTMTVCLGMFGLGLLTAVIYVVGVLPRFAAATPIDDAFRR
jgi:hypothetical protein